MESKAKKNEILRLVIYHKFLLARDMIEVVFYQ